MVDSGSRWGVYEVLVPCHVSVLLFQDPVEVVDAELPGGAEDIEAAREDQVDVLVAENVTMLEVNHKAIGGQEIHAEDGLLDHLEFPPVLPALKL